MEDSGKLKKRKSYKERRVGAYQRRLIYDDAIKDKAIELLKKINRKNNYGWTNLLIELQKTFPKNKRLKEGMLSHKTVKAWDEKKNLVVSSASEYSQEAKGIKPPKVSPEEN